MGMSGEGAWEGPPGDIREGRGEGLEGMRLADVSDIMRCYDDTLGYKVKLV